MGEDDALVEEFFAEVNDKYYPQVLEGLELLEAREVAQGVETLARPLHTIKGVTGFMGGFEAASGFTHKVEDFLKKIQSGEVAATEHNVTLLSLGVNMIFSVIEQIREQGAPDAAEVTDMLELLRQASGPGGANAAETEARVEASQRDGVLVLRVLARRIHLKPERERLTQAIAAVPEKGRVLIDLSAVLSVGSAAWESLAALAESRDIAVCGMSFDCRGVFYSWGLDRTIRAFAGVEDFFQDTAAPGGPPQ